MQLPLLPTVYFVTDVCVGSQFTPGSSSLARTSPPALGGVCITHVPGLQVAAKLAQWDLMVMKRQAPAWVFADRI